VGNDVLVSTSSADTGDKQRNAANGAKIRVRVTKIREGKSMVASASICCDADIPDTFDTLKTPS